MTRAGLRRRGLTAAAVRCHLPRPGRHDRADHRARSRCSAQPIATQVMAATGGTRVHARADRSCPRHRRHPAPPGRRSGAASGRVAAGAAVLVLVVLLVHAGRRRGRGAVGDDPVVHARRGAQLRHGGADDDRRPDHDRRGHDRVPEDRLPFDPLAPCPAWTAGARHKPTRAGGAELGAGRLVEAAVGHRAVQVVDLLAGAAQRESLGVLLRHEHARRTAPRRGSRRSGPRSPWRRADSPGSVFTMWAAFGGPVSVRSSVRVSVRRSIAPAAARTGSSCAQPYGTAAGTELA